MTVPLVRLSALEFLRGFVAVGRRMSISLAAEDLCLSPSALSKQITKLEESLGVRLLVRGHRSISFTKEGAELFRIANSSLQQLQDVIGEILPNVSWKPVTVTASIGVTSLWLLPRLGTFQSLHPDIDVRVAASNAILDLRAEDIDLSIRYCSSSAPPANSIRLFGESVHPVVSPLLRLESITSAEALSDQVLIEFDDPRRPWLQWSTWIAAAGWKIKKPKGVLRFNQYDLVIQAAMAGQGIALGRLELLTRMMMSKQLKILDAPATEPLSDFCYWLVTAEKFPRRSVQNVFEWIAREATTEGGNSDTEGQVRVQV